MTKLTADFTGIESATTRLSRLQTIHDFWFGTGAFALAETLGGARAEMNVILDPENWVADADAFGTWLIEWNKANNPEEWLSDTLKTVPASMGIFNTTLNKFGADGVTAPDVAGAVSLLGDAADGLVLGAELVVNGDFNDPSGWTLDTGWAIAAGRATKTAGVAGIAARSMSVTASRAYLVEMNVVSVADGTSVRPVIAGGTNVVGNYVAGAGVNKQVLFALSGNNSIRLDAAADKASVVESISVREILNLAFRQNTAAARPLLGRAPKDVRNRLISTENFENTEWNASEGITRSGRTFTETATTEIHRLRHNFQFVLGTPYSISFKVQKSETRRLYVNANAGLGASALLNIAAAGGTVVQKSGVNQSTTIFTIAPVVNDPDFYACTVKGVGRGDTPGIFWQMCPTSHVTASDLVYLGDGVSSITLKDLQIEVGTEVTNYQKVGATVRDITEVGVPSYNILSMDGSDDALLAQLTTGGTVSVAVFGRGGSYIIENVTLAAPSVLAIGPLSILDDGVLLPGAAFNLLRLLGIVPWSSRFQIVGAAIMKPTPTQSEKDRVMRYFAAHGAKGWFNDGPELLTSGVLFDGIAAGELASSAEVEQEVTTTAGAAYVVRFTVAGAATFCGAWGGSGRSGNLFSSASTRGIGDGSFVFVAGGATSYPSFSGSAETAVSNISIKQLIQEPV